MSELTHFFSDEDISIEQQKEGNMEMPNLYPVSELAKNEWKEFALYTVEARAIPNMVDGMKPSHRFYLYSSIKNTSRDFKKVESVMGTVTDYGYNHGTGSAGAAGQMMASEWANNICLVEGRGSFGTRLVQTAAAPRYTQTRLHPNFHKYVKDIDLSPKHSDPEHHPPAFYIPIIPLVLANGVKGIATGFATNILPRDPIAIAAACREFVETGNIAQKLPIKFPEFTGTATFNDSEGRFICLGTYELKSKTVLAITEIPYGFDHESYVKVLDKLEEDGHIVSYDDQCDDNGFQFEVKLKQSIATDLTDAKIIQMFKLSKPMSENITVIDFNGKLREYTDERDLVKDFCEYRNGILGKRIALRQEEYSEEVRWLSVKMEFIQAVIDGKIKFKNQKKDAVCKQILAETSALETDCDRLLRINIMNLTDEMVKQLKVEIEDAKKSLKFWKTTTVKQQFISDLDDILKVA